LKTVSVDTLFDCVGRGTLAFLRAASKNFVLVGTYASCTSDDDTVADTVAGKEVDIEAGKEVDIEAGKEADTVADTVAGKEADTVAGKEADTVAGIT
jgi:hypothetical protein